MAKDIASPNQPGSNQPSSDQLAPGQTSGAISVDGRSNRNFRSSYFKRKSPYHLGLTGWIIVSTFTIILAVLLRAFVVQTFKIPSESMLPTLVVGDHIIVSRLAYGLYLPGVADPIIRMGEPRRNDVVVFSKFSEFEDREAGKHYIKRIVAVPGDSVEVRNFRAYVNGDPADKGHEIIIDVDPAALEAVNPNYGPVKLEDGQYFVLGDNRVNSQDSRYFGAINRYDIEGRAWLIYWSWELLNGSYRIRWDRIGDVVG